MCVCVWERSPLRQRIPCSFVFHQAWLTPGFTLVHTGMYEDAESAPYPVAFLSICETGWHTNARQHQWARVRSRLCRCVCVSGWRHGEGHSLFQRETITGEGGILGVPVRSCIKSFRVVLVQCKNQRPNIGSWLTVCLHVSATAAVLWQPWEPGSLPGLSAWPLTFAEQPSSSISLREIKACSRRNRAEFVFHSTEDCFPDVSLTPKCQFWLHGC